MTFAPGRTRLAKALPLLAASFASIGALAGVSSPITASAASTYEAPALERRLFDLLVGDRYRVGLAGLVWNPTMGVYASGASYQPCPGVTAHGRSQDMAERNYFGHGVPPCGGSVFPTLGRAGVAMQMWGENIAWTQGNDAGSADTVNSAFLNSAEHRANVLGRFNSVGIGVTVDGVPWTGAGAPRSGVIIYSVLFASIPGVHAPGPPQPPAPPVPQAPAPAAAAPPPQPVAAAGEVAAATAPAPVDPNAAAGAGRRVGGPDPGLGFVDSVAPGGGDRDLAFFGRVMSLVVLLALLGAGGAWLRVRRSP